MKNNKKLFTAMLLSTVIAGSANAGINGNATETFTWSGTVPAKPISNSIVITSITSAALDDGKLNFSKDGDLIGSTSINFKVQKVADVGNAPVDFTAEELSTTNLSYKVLSFQSEGSKSGLNDNLGIATQYYALNSGSEVLQLNTSVPMPANNVQLALGKSTFSTNATNKPVQGEVVTVQAVIMVEADII